MIELSNRDARIAEEQRRRRETTDLYARRVKERQREQRIDAAISLAKGAAPLLLGLTLFALLVAWLGNGCGDVVHADEGADLAGPSDGPEAPTPIGVGPLVDAEAFALHARMRAWQPTWRARRDGELEAVALAIVRACRHNPWPTAERCPDLLGALAFRESSWRADAIGARLERGLFQLHGIARGGESDAELLDPEVNARLALVHLRRAEAHCRIVGRGDVSTSLGCYGSGRCRAYRGSRLLERWEIALRAAGGVS